MDGQEVNAAVPWLPLDERFDESKAANFKSRTKYTLLPVVATLLGVGSQATLSRS